MWLSIRLQRGKNNIPFGIMIEPLYPRLSLVLATMYPTPQEKAIIDEAEKIMVETMARYDPSHDQYHGEEPSRSKWTNLSPFLFSSTRQKNSPCACKRHLANPRSFDC